MNGCLSEVHLLQGGKFHRYWISWVRDFYRGRSTYFKSRRWIMKHNFCYIDTTDTHINRFQTSVLSHIKTRLQLQINLNVLPNKFLYSLKRIVFRTDCHLLLSLLNTFSCFPHSVRLVFITCVSVMHNLCFSYWLSLLSWATSSAPLLLKIIDLP